MSERAIEITETFRPASHGRKRAVIVEGIPALELALDGETEIVLKAGVTDRVRILIQRALRSNDAAEQRISYSAPIRRKVQAARAAYRARP